VGLAFQWVLNPWQPSFGELLAWSQHDGGSWTSAGHLTPDTEWHQIRMGLNPRDGTASLQVDDMLVPAELVSEEKSRSWEARSIARLQAEVVSMFPGERTSAPGEQVERVDVGRSHDGEVSVIEGGDSGLILLFGCGNEAGVDETEPEIVVDVDELNATLVEGSCEIDNGDSPGCDRCHEGLPLPLDRVSIRSSKLSQRRLVRSL
jgi:hypothetical protein